MTSRPIPAIAEHDRASADPRRSKHEHAVANTLSLADQAAAHGDFAEALAWLDTLDAIGERLPELYAGKRAAWAHEYRARLALDAARKRLRLAAPKATQRMLELGEALDSATSRRMLLDRALEGAMTLLGADLGNVQVRNPSSGALTIATSSGFDSEFLEYFAVVDDDSSACGRAAQQRSQTLIVDVRADAGFAPHREIAASSGFRSVQSTPIVDPAGGLHGVISTHFPAPHLLCPAQMQLTAWFSERVGAALAGLQMA